MAVNLTVSYKLWGGCAGVHGCGSGQKGGCTGVHGCVHDCEWVYSGLCGCVQVCPGMCGCAQVCGMNFQNFFWRIES